MLGEAPEWRASGSAQRNFDDETALCLRRPTRQPLATRVF